jgi:hypothetical protein
MENEIIEKAKELLKPITYDAPYVAYYVTINGKDLGYADFCEDCIKAEVKKCRKEHFDERRKIIEKFNEIEKTGFYNGVNIREKNSEKEIRAWKRYELKEYPAHATFNFEGHDPDFGGGEREPKCCENCGEYFYTDFEPDLEYAQILLEDCGDFSELSESLKWKLDIAFYNFDFLDKNVQKILLKIAKNIIKNDGH